MTALILASSSPRRRELLSTLGIPFTIRKPNLDESQHPHESPLDYVRRLSQEKAAHIASSLAESSFRNGEESKILAADTIVLLSADTLGIDEQGQILGKPADANDARQMLHRLRGRTHQVCTAITLMTVGALREAPSLTELTCTDVTMRDYADAEIEAYIATGDPFDKAGSYAIQHPVFRPVARVDGCYTNVVGLPMCTLKRMLAQSGWPDLWTKPICNCQEQYAGVFF
jgi:MAF protein